MLETSTCPAFVFENDIVNTLKYQDFHIQITSHSVKKLQLLS